MTASRPSSPRPASGWSRRRGSASPSASTCSASAPRSRCDAQSMPDGRCGAVTSERAAVAPAAGLGGGRADGELLHRRVRPRRAGRRVRHAAVRLRRGAPAGPLPRGGRGLRRRRGLRGQGVPLPGDGPAGPRGGHAPRRRDRRRAARRAGRRRARRPARAARQQQERRRAAPAREAGVGRIVVDSFDELDRLEALHAADGDGARRCCCGSRPGVEAHTHEFVQTGQDDSKFGFGARRRATRPSGGAGRGVGRGRAGRASTPTSAARCSSPTSSTRRSRCSRRSSTPLGLPELSIGGGLGVAYVEGEEAPTHHRVGRRSCATRAPTAGITARVTAEPGRAIAAAAARHALHGRAPSRTCPASAPTSSVDGGIQRQPAARALRQRLRDVPARGPSPPTAPTPSASSASTASRATCSCATARSRPTWSSGDLLATPVTGAYGHSMGSNYNKVPRPAVVFVPRRRGPPGRPARDRRRPPPPRRALTSAAGAIDAGRPEASGSGRRDATTWTGTIGAGRRARLRQRRRARSCSSSTPGATTSRPAPACASRSPGSRCAASPASGRSTLPARRPHPRRGRGRRRPRRRRRRRGHRRHRAGPRADPRRAEGGQAGGHRATRSCWPTTAPSCSRRPRPPASTCCSRRRWPAASRSSGRCASRSPASTSAGSWASSTARPTTSSPA